MLNTTDALNTAINGTLAPGDHAICTGMEHNSAWRPLISLKQRGVELSVVPAGTDGVVQAAEIERAVRSNTRLIAMLHASNVNCAIWTVAEVGSFARERGIWLLVDAAQSAGSLRIDVQAVNIDLLAFPGHKGLLGPQGTGGLYVGEQVSLRPLKEGGTGSQSHSPYQPTNYPDRLESGTLNIPGIAGLNAGVKYLLREGIDRIARRERTLLERLLCGLKSVEGVGLYGPSDDVLQAAVVSFNIRNLDPTLVAAELERRADMACRPGWHCAGLAHRNLGTHQTGTVRLSPGPFTREDEIDAALAAVADIAKADAASLNLS